MRRLDARFPSPAKPTRDGKFSACDSIGLNVTKFAPLFLRKSPDSATHCEGGGLAVVPHHQIAMSHLAMPHFGAERRIDSAVRAVYLGIAVFGIDLLNPRASPQRSRRLESVGV